MHITRLLSLVLILSTAKETISYSSEEDEEEDRFELTNAADAFDLVFSVVVLDEQCRVTYQNCVLNENNNNRLDMNMKCDIISKAVLCLERDQFRANSECGWDRAEDKVDRYRTFFVGLLNRCEIQGGGDRLKLSGSISSSFWSSSSSTTNYSSHRCLILSLLFYLFLVFTHSFRVF
jgi:hypothetical protein